VSPADATVLVVDDDELLRQTYRLMLESGGYQCLEAGTALEAHRLLADADTRPEAIVLDVMLGEDDGLMLLSDLLDRYPGVPVLMSTSSRKVEHAIYALKRGAYDYLVKPVEREELLIAVRNAVERSTMSRELAARRALDRSSFERTPQGIFASTAMKLVLSSLERAKDSRVAVLVLGESGTGKEVVSRWLHESGRFSQGPFVAVNCAALPTELVESELFGHVKGAFTGADADRDGRFTEANGGTLFLDEIGELDLAVQAKLLRALERGEVTPVGGTARVVDARVVAATNRDLAAEVTAGRFREDLFYRLDVFTVRIPPLRERRDEIEVLADHFLKTFCAAEGFGDVRFTEAALEVLRSHPWPGNVRELENTIKRSVLRARGETLDAADIQLTRSPTPTPSPAPDPSMPIREGIQSENRERMLRALADTRGNVAAAARQLGIGRSTFYRWAKTHSIPL
jgi:DNA-binding NtrC family response regulator